VYGDLFGKPAMRAVFGQSALVQSWLDVEDDHTRIGSPSVAIIPPPSIHTSQSMSSGPNQLIDIFSPPRFDLSDREGWVLARLTTRCPGERKAYDRSTG